MPYREWVTENNKFQKLEVFKHFLNEPLPPKYISNHVPDFLRQTSSKPLSHQLRNYTWIIKVSVQVTLLSTTAGQKEMKRNHYRQKRCLLNTVHWISLWIYHTISNNKSSIQESITSFKWREKNMQRSFVISENI